MFAIPDFDAVSASEQQIAFAYGPRTWWSPNLTYEANLADLARHELEFNQRQAFAYAMLQGDEYLGCVYIRPAATQRHYQAQIYFWLAAGQHMLGEDAALQMLRSWISMKWPFSAVVFPGRTMRWEEWAALC